MMRKTTWVTQQHHQIKGCVSVLSSKVDVGSLTQQVFDDVFVAGRRQVGESDVNYSTALLKSPR